MKLMNYNYLNVAALVSLTFVGCGYSVPLPTTPVVAPTTTTAAANAQGTNGTWTISTTCNRAAGANGTMQDIVDAVDLGLANRPTLIMGTSARLTVITAIQKIQETYTFGFSETATNTATGVTGYPGGLLQNFTGTYGSTANLTGTSTITLAKQGLPSCTYGSGAQCAGDNLSPTSNGQWTFSVDLTQISKALAANGSQPQAGVYNPYGTTTSNQLKAGTVITATQPTAGQDLCSLLYAQASGIPAATVSTPSPLTLTFVSP